MILMCTSYLISLDGGGVRGLASLLILDYVIKAVDSKNPPKPCDFFDIIGGTSTGGSVLSSILCLLLVGFVIY
jgi:patatin-like phospholipase/acyl hydrolase